MNALGLAALLAATVAMGLMAGVFFLYAHAIMPGLRNVDDRTFVGAFQQVDTAIEQPRFVPIVGGAFVFTVFAGVLHLDTGRSVLAWVAAALALYVISMVMTAAVNVPRNHAIRALGPPDGIEDLAAARARFDESRWIAWNLARAILTSTAFGLLVWSLVLRGRLDHAL